MPLAAPAITALRGRDFELNAFGEHLAGAVAGQGSIVLLEGRPGYGKSRLLDEAARMARRLAMRVGVAAADPGDNVIPQRALMRALFEGSTPVLDHAAMPDLSASPDQLYWLLHELEAMLETAALTTPVLVCIDDLQWADRGTIAALRALAAWLVALPIVWIASYRPEQVSADLNGAIDELMAVGAQRLVLGPLTNEAVRQIVADVMHGDPGIDLLEIAERAHGSPFLLMELLLGLQEEGLVEISDGRAELLASRLPARVRDSMRHRLDRMSAPARHTAVVASVLGRSFSFEQLVSMLDRTPASMLDPVGELVRADVLVESEHALAFRHDLTREAVLESIPAPALRALDRQAAEMLLRAGVAPVEIAARLAASAEPGDRVAIATLQQAAHALANTDPRAASELSRKALALLPEGAAERVPLVRETALLLHAAGNGDEAKRFADDVLRDVVSADEEAEIRVGISAMYTLRADLRVDTAAVSLARADVSPPLRARLLATQVLNLVAAGRPDDACELEREANVAVSATGDEFAGVALEFGRLALDEAEERYDAMLERARSIHHLGQAEGQDAIVRAAEWLLSNGLAAMGRIDDALELATEGLDSALRDRQGWMAPRWEIWRGRFLLMAGQLHDAGAALEGVFADGQMDCPVTIPDAAGALALGRIAIHTGDPRQSLRSAKIARATLRVDHSDARRQVMWLLALQAMARGEPAAARAELGEDARLPVLARDVCDEPQLVRLALAASDISLAERALEVAEHRARSNPGIPLIAGAAAHARGLLHADAGELMTAIEQLRGAPRPLVLASALEDLGHVLTPGDAAVRALGEALEIYATSAAAWDANRVRGRLRALGVRRRLVPAVRPDHGWDALTDSELRAARLVAAGNTNREAAAALYVSPHTVGTHLRHAFVKLGINSRVELARIAAEHDG
jgi:DNA-binding CsgD family transcriptional regulator/tetratricopeptide (TPR) repeat protein